MHMSNKNNTPKEYTLQEVADRFRVSRMTIIRWCRAGHFPNARKKNPFAAYNSPTLIPSSDVEKFEKSYEKAQPTY